MKHFSQRSCCKYLDHENIVPFCARSTSSLILCNYRECVLIRQLKWQSVNTLLLLQKFWAMHSFRFGEYSFYFASFGLQFIYFVWLILKLSVQHIDKIDENKFIYCALWINNAFPGLDEFCEIDHNFDIGKRADFISLICDNYLKSKGDIAKQLPCLRGSPSSHN